MLQTRAKWRMLKLFLNMDAHMKFLHLHTSPTITDSLDIVHCTVFIYIAFET
jgi:hypothetical protein